MKEVVSSNKETNELLTVPAKFVDSTYQALADGKFDPLTDFTKYIDDILAIQSGVEGINKVKEENATMSIEDRDGVLKNLSSNMPSVPETDRYDISAGIHGLLSIFRIGWRKGHEKGLAEGQEQLVAKLKSDKVQVNDL